MVSMGGGLQLIQCSVQRPSAPQESSRSALHGARLPQVKPAWSGEQGAPFAGRTSGQPAPSGPPEPSRAESPPDPFPDSSPASLTSAPQPPPPNVSAPRAPTRNGV